ncbi:amidohydrolase family protein [Pedobacter arcticus]|uniref:amidohydrolase family protein n=1 Tax=Pedobacter arcticus TaxID=752140 RepID=UPI0002DF9692|nr:amidohydrolase family protein [Pedobacter arcticus]
MLKLDTHQHFWKYNPVKHAWINQEMAVIQKDFMPLDLQPVLKNADVNGCIAVQTDEDEGENEFLLALAKENDFIKGIIGWVDFLSADISDRLAYYNDFKTIKGFRYILQDKAQRDLILSKEFIRGIVAMNAYDFVYELLVFPDQLKYAEQLVNQFPNQVFVLDHLAKPAIKSGEINQWKTAITALAKHENVHCKVSGMITEADWNNWSYPDFIPYMDVVFSAFGMDRVMFGSDWPVCNLAGNYQKVMRVVAQQVSNLSLNEQEKFWSSNAIKCYKL